MALEGVLVVLASRLGSEQAQNNPYSDGCQRQCGWLPQTAHCDE